MLFSLDFPLGYGFTFGYKTNGNSYKPGPAPRAEIIKAEFNVLWPNLKNHWHPLGVKHSDYCVKE